MGQSQESGNVRHFPGVMTPVPVKSYCCSLYNTMFISVDHLVFGVGSNRNNQLGYTHTRSFYEFTALPLPPDSLITTICMSRFVTMLIDENGNAYQLAANPLGQTAGYFAHNNSVPRLIPELKNIQAISSGENHFLCIEANSGALWTFGRNMNGELGNGTFTHSIIPQLVDLPPVSKVFFSRGPFSIVQIVSGELYGFGNNSCGQLGLPLDQELIATPTLIPFAHQVEMVDSGEEHTVILDSQGQLWGIGCNQWYQLGIHWKMSQSLIFGRLKPISRNI
jgi:alpha-tubulin suppressor-like RCC1 family protein